MDILILVKAIIIGFLVALPIGPIAILCIQRTLSQGRLYGIIFGLGVATADALYGSIAAFGITVISNFLISQKLLIKLIGGLFLIFIGCKKILNESTISTTHLKKTNLINDYTSAFFLTLTNPITIIIFATIFSLPWINIDTYILTYFDSFLLISGIFIGSSLWFTLLSFIVGLFRSTLSKKYLNLFNIISGSVIIAFGVFSLLSLVIH